MPGHRDDPTHSHEAGGGVDLAAHAPLRDASAASEAVLQHLRAALGFRFWAVTRVTGQTYAVVSTGEAGFPLAPGAQLPWDEALCRLVLDGRAPRVAPDTRAFPALAGAPLARQWHVGAYLSAPLTLDGVSLFGTLCALDTRPQPAPAAAGVELVDLQARLLSTLLAAELRTDASRRRAERAEAEALTDPLTGLVNRRGWELLLQREEQRCRRYGGLASVLVLDLDGLKAVNDSQGHAAGDAVLRRAAQVLRGAVRSADVTARLGGDEFAVLAVETDLPAALAERDRLSGLFGAAGVPASVGAAVRDPQHGLAAAWVNADTDMYRVKGDRPRPSR